MVNQKIAVAGATGNLGHRMVYALRKRGAEVIALVRPGTDSGKRESLSATGATVVEVDLSDVARLAAHLANVDGVVSALVGLREIIIDGQASLLKAAERAGVKRFIPSDYCLDYTAFPQGQNRNLDLRREFGVMLDRSPIAATSIFCGAFSTLLTHVPIILDMKSSRVSFWENSKQPMNFTAIDDVAQFTAAAALDIAAPRYLRVASETVSAGQLAELASGLKGTSFELHCAADLSELSQQIKEGQSRADPNDTDIYPLWQTLQHLRNMFDGSGVFETTDNGRYPQISWTPLSELISQVLPSRF